MLQVYVSFIIQLIRSNCFSVHTFVLMRLTSKTCVCTVIGCILGTNRATILLFQNHCFIFWFISNSNNDTVAKYRLNSRKGWQRFRERIRELCLSFVFFDRTIDHKKGLQSFAQLLFALADILCFILVHLCRLQFFKTCLDFFSQACFFCS